MSDRTEAERQLDAINAMASTEEADVDYLMDMLGINHEWGDGREYVRSFRKQIIIATAVIVH